MTERRFAQVRETPIGEPLVCMALSGDDLRALGIDPNPGDQIAYHVKDGELRLDETERAEETEVAVAPT